VRKRAQILSPDALVSGSPYWMCLLGGSVGDVGEFGWSGGARWRTDTGAVSWLRCDSRSARKHWLRAGQWHPAPRFAPAGCHWSACCQCWRAQRTL